MASAPHQRPGASWHSPIILDDEIDFSPTGQGAHSLAQRVRDYRPQAGGEIPDFEYNQEEEDAELLGIREVIDLTSDEDLAAVPAAESLFKLRRLRHDERRYGSAHWNQTILNVGAFIEIQEREWGGIPVQFLKIHDIIQNSATYRITLRGIPYARHRSMQGILPRKRNEVCAIWAVVEKECEVMMDVNLDSAIIPRILKTTNAAYPLHRQDPSETITQGNIDDYGELVCRWKYIMYFKDAKVNKAHLYELKRIQADEVSVAGYRYSEEHMRQEWRGNTIRGGSHNATRPINSVENGDLIRAPGQAYTVFDSFCGAGGFSRGAERAGFKIAYGVDNAEGACETYRLNFPQAELFQMTCDEFISSTMERNVRADILHLSPPCQYFSPAHTIAGANDEANVAALFACRAMIERVRPRFFTLEQTAGLFKPQHRAYFNQLLAGFTDLGYSVTWKVVTLADWGLPQLRRRLIMIGAGPGEKLPPFPQASHSEEGNNGLPTYVTIRQALSKIRDGHSNHVKRYRAPNATGPDVLSTWDQILPRCITCSGGGNGHPDGERSFTHREFASLQGFPIWHRFVGKGIMRQIGNAFPPSVVRHLYRHLEQFILKEDRVRILNPHTHFRDGPPIGHNGSVDVVMADAMESTASNAIIIADSDDVEMHDSSTPLSRAGGVLGPARLPSHQSASLQGHLRGRSSTVVAR